MSRLIAMTWSGALSDGLEDGQVLHEPPAFVWPLAGPFGAVLLSAMAWLSI